MKAIPTIAAQREDAGAQAARKMLELAREEMESAQADLLTRWAPDPANYNRAFERYQTATRIYHELERVARAFFHL